MTVEGAVSDAKLFPAEAAISARTSMLVVALCWIAIFSEGYDVGVLGAILPALATDASWKLTPIELGAMGSYTLFGMLVGGIFSGTLSELYGRKPLFVGCLTLFAACMVVTAWAPTPAWFGVSRFIAGLGLGGIIPVAAALTIEYSPARRKSLNYGIMYSGYSVGILVAALVGKALLPDHGWRPVVLVGALPVVFVPLMIWLLPELLESLVARGRSEAARTLAARLDMAVPPGAAKATGTIGWRSVLGEIFSPRNAFATVCFWIALFMGLLLVYGIAQWLPQIMRKSGYNLGDSLLFLAVFSFTSAIGGIVLGQWADRFGVRLTVTLCLSARRRRNRSSRVQGIDLAELRDGRGRRVWNSVGVAGPDQLSRRPSRAVRAIRRHRLGAQFRAHRRADRAIGRRLRRKPQCRPAVEFLRVCDGGRDRRAGDGADPRQTRSGVKRRTDRSLQLECRETYPSSTASAAFTASAPSVTVFSSEPACTVTFSAKNRATAT